jgi:Cu/Zn superoxide dismutase
MRRWQGITLALALAVLAGLGSIPNVAAQGQTVTVEMTSQNNSGVTGTATLTEIGSGKLRVEIRANGSGAGPQPAHIHEGNCAQLNPAPKFPLNNVVNGSSTTEIDGSIAALLAAPHAVHMHKSPDELPVYVACADIKMGGRPSTLPPAGEASAAPGFAAGMAGVGLLLVAMGRGLWRRTRY